MGSRSILPVSRNTTNVSEAWMGLAARHNQDCAGHAETRGTLAPNPDHLAIVDDHQPGVGTAGVYPPPGHIRGHPRPSSEPVEQPHRNTPHR